MARFFMAAANIPKSGSVLLTGADADHARVLRLRVGDRIILCDGEGTDHRCTVKRISRGELEAEVEEHFPNAAEPSLRCTVLAGLPKQGERADYVVQKCTECGAAEIRFFFSRRTVADPSPSALENRLTRWNRIAEEAAKQSGRGIIPQVSILQSFPEVLDVAIKTQLPLFFYETGNRVPLKQALEGRGVIADAAIITGPEGGFEPFEAELAEKIGFPICSMGPRIFRCETAPVAALTALMFATGNL